MTYDWSNKSLWSKLTLNKEEIVINKRMQKELYWNYKIICRHVGMVVAKIIYKTQSKNMKMRTENKSTDNLRLFLSHISTEKCQVIWHFWVRVRVVCPLIHG